ncbi:T9SS type B sorting domain-containing protein [Pontibacter silvestris]|uniref:T9SS type B sorting domain-containing protein n=1 Tax=Pontibacter silvestris TaxID=2305183 RepID=A0ABW4WSQ5_9BACT|nr:T9SS type B sorting domain-containing protein [Pontibacter silvestris]MCC9137780.1 gliding motility-associated C-terminal domain-containing protein [Pontibacter silvestris]
MKNLLVLLFLIVSTSSWAQTLCFKAYDAQNREITTICAGQEVLFQDCGNTIPDENEYYVFDYTSGTPIPTPSSTTQKHTYDTPGTYRVLQIANYGGSRLTDTVSQVFEVKTTPTPVFSAFACANRQVSVHVTDTQYDTYQIDYGNGQSQLISPGQQISYTYATAGPYAITINGTYLGSYCTGSSTLQVEDLAPYLPPVISRLQVQTEDVTNGSISFTIDNLIEGYAYTIERKAATGSVFTKVTTLVSSQPTFTLTNVNTNEAALYRIVAQDRCGSNLSSSNLISTITLEATGGDEQINLTWQSVAGQQERYELYRNGNLLKSFDKAATNFTDMEVSCGEEYCYQLRGLSSNGQVTSVTAEACVMATSTSKPDKAQLFSTFNLNNQIELILQLPQGQTLKNTSFERSISGAPYQLISSGPQPEYTDATLTPQEVCYRARYTNACDNSSDYSNISCPIILEATQADDASVSLEWTSYTGFSDGVSQYSVELLDQNNNIIASYQASGTTYMDRSLPDEPFFQYRIKAISISNTATSYSNIVSVKQPIQLYVPSAFTPNNDGLNDVLEVKGKFFSNYSITIYNRLGNVVHQSTNVAEGWDGTFKGNPVPADVYTYDIKVTTAEDDLKHRTGTITLIR